MSVPEALMLLSLVPLPIALGLWCARAGRPWWWAASASAVLFVIAAVAPTPEPGEARVDAGDAGFLLVCCGLIAGIAGLTHALARRAARRGPSR